MEGEGKRVEGAEERKKEEDGGENGSGEREGSECRERRRMKQRARD